MPYQAISDKPMPYLIYVNANLKYWNTLSHN